MSSIQTNAQRTANVLQKFNRPEFDYLHRAYDHLISARLGMTLMVPVAVTTGRLVPIVDRCPVPWMEATEILSADYSAAVPLSLVDLVQNAQSIKDPMSSLGLFAQAVIDSFIGTETDFAVALIDKDWRHTSIIISRGGQPSRVFIGSSGVRLAFTPDFLEGVI